MLVEAAAGRVGSPDPVPMWSCRPYFCLKTARGSVPMAAGPPGRPSHSRLDALTRPAMNPLKKPPHDEHILQTFLERRTRPGSDRVHIDAGICRIGVGGAVLE